jgi:hypothetical protein
VCGSEFHIGEGVKDVVRDDIIKKEKVNGLNGSVRSERQLKIDINSAGPFDGGIKDVVMIGRND